MDPKLAMNKEEGSGTAPTSRVAVSNVGPEPPNKAVCEVDVYKSGRVLAGFSELLITNSALMVTASPIDQEFAGREMMYAASLSVKTPWLPVLYCHPPQLAATVGDPPLIEYVRPPETTDPAVEGPAVLNISKITMPAALAVPWLLVIVKVSFVIDMVILSPAWEKVIAPLARGVEAIDMQSTLSAQMALGLVLI